MYRLNPDDSYIVDYLKQREQKLQQRVLDTAVLHEKAKVDLERCRQELARAQWGQKTLFPMATLG